MNKPAFTPGPWRISRKERPPIGRQASGEPWSKDANGNVFWGYSVSGSSEAGAAILPTLAAVHNFPDQIDANARLISAAPDLYEALDHFVTTAERVGLRDGNMPEWLPKAKAALAKARGEE
jgi:hypothetical protein